MKDIYVNSDGVICDGETKTPFEDQEAIGRKLALSGTRSNNLLDTFYQIEADWEIVEIMNHRSSPTAASVPLYKVARLKVPAPTVATDNSGDIALINLEKLKRVCYHFAGAVHVGHDFNSSDSFDRAWREWVKTGKINPWHSHRDTSKEAVQVTELISYVKSSPVEEEQNELWKELIDLYDIHDASSYGYGVLINKLSEKFTITRKEKV